MARLPGEDRRPEETARSGTPPAPRQSEAEDHEQGLPPPGLWVALAVGDAPYVLNCVQRGASCAAPARTHAHAITILTLHARNTANITSVAASSTFSKEANFITVLRFLTPARPYLIPCERRHRANGLVTYI